MKRVEIICAVAAVCCTLWIKVEAQAEPENVQVSSKRYHGFAYGDPQHCAWQACSIDYDCVAIDNDRCLGPIVVNRDSAVSAQTYLDSFNMVFDCNRLEPSAPGDVKCENRRCQLKVNDRRNLCLQRTLSEDIIRRCFANELDVCPEAAYRADVWSLQPRYDAILEYACDREHAQSCFVMGSNHRDTAEATLLLTRACELKSAHSCLVLGRRVAEKDPFNSWFHAACDIDSSFCVQIGKILTKDREDSAPGTWFKRGCEKGDRPSCVALASREQALQSLQRVRERAVERSLSINETAHKMWEGIVRDNREEMEGATFLGVERSRPGYSIGDYIVIRFSTKNGEIKQIVLPAE